MGVASDFPHSTVTVPHGTDSPDLAKNFAHGRDTFVSQKTQSRNHNLAKEMVGSFALGHGDDGTSTACRITEVSRANEVGFRPEDGGNLGPAEAIADPRE